MNVSRAQLYLSLLGPQLVFHLEEIQDIACQGFDLQVSAPAAPILEALLLLCAEWQEAGKLEFLYVTTQEALHELQGSSEKEPTGPVQPLVYIGDPLPLGKFFLVPYKLPPVSTLLGNLPKAILAVLKSFDLVMYMDVFDGPMVKRLKRVLDNDGLDVFLDAVVQVAFLAGFRGEVSCALRYLDELHVKRHLASLQTAQKSELKKCVHSVFNHVLKYQGDSYEFIKASFCYFVLSREGHNFSRASKILNLSRTTIQQYAKRAQHLGVRPFLFD